jgi:trehalose/maltose hydrolase-like predicted phosphorylase
LTDKPYGGIDNNAYTNVMTAWLMLRVLDVLALLPQRRRSELTETLGLGLDEVERWALLSRRMYVPFHGEGIISQFEGYDRLRELDWDAYRAKYGDLQRLDRVLAAEGDSTNHYQASKQADVLMLFYLLSADELRELFGHLGYPLPPETIRRTTDYYLARTSHGSTLSAVVHAWVLARAHRNQALDYFMQALDSDITDIQGGTTAEGIHLAAMAGSVDLLQRCFAGIETRADTLYFNPYWPDELGTLEFDLRYRGHSLNLRVNGDRIQVYLGAGAPSPIILNCRGQLVEVAAGGAATFPLPDAPEN